MTPSVYQQAVYDWIRNGTGHAVINAVAGSGKTTTLVESMRIMPTINGRKPKVLFLAFNRHIRDELKTRVPYNVEVNTFNAFGWGICRNNQRGVDFKSDKDRILLNRLVNPETEKERYARLRNPVFKVIGLLKSLGRLDTTTALKDADDYGIELGDLKPEDKFQEVLAEIYKKSVLQIATMDYADQLFQPVIRNWPVPEYDFVMIDEGQDCSPVQITMAQRLAEKGRIVIVGDPDQSIYLFRGAHPDAMNEMAKILNATELPLSVCYRCPTAIADLARQEVPRLESLNPNPKGDGEVADFTTELFEKAVRPGDYVACRTTAPLVKRCLRQLSVYRRKAIVKGRDLSNQLIDLIEKIHGNPNRLMDEYNQLVKFKITPATKDLVAFMEKLKEYEAEQKARLERQGRDAEMQILEDRVLSIEYFAEEKDYVVELIIAIETIFSDDEIDGVTFLTGHKAKGLEGERWWWLRPDQCPSPKAKTEAQRRQEKNLIYVIKTRSKSFLGIVQKEPEER